MAKCGDWVCDYNKISLPALSNISLRQLLVIIVAYSFLISGLHQLWFVIMGLDSGSWNHFIAMFCRDVAGSILFVAVIKYGIDWLKEDWVELA